MLTNIQIYPWFQFFRNLLFWQAIWFLYFQQELSAAEAILLAAIYDIGTTALEVPSGYLSDRVGRRVTLIAAAAAGATGSALIAFGEGFYVFAIAQILLGASTAFGSGTDSALLFESLNAKRRGREIAQHELLAWRFNFTALALSAVTGGYLASGSASWAFLASALAALAALLLALRFEEPPHSVEALPYNGLGDQLRAVGQALRNPILGWLFVLSAGMYVFSHVPFTFGQPFLLQAIEEHGASLDAPVVSGWVTTAMMSVSVAASWLAAPLRKSVGLRALLLIALSMQIALIAMLAATNHPLAVALLMLRMVPDALSRPFILAQIQPLLNDRSRATYLSFQSLCGRLILAATLVAVSTGAPDQTILSYPDIRHILYWYAGGGLLVLALLAFTGKRMSGLGRD